LTLNAGSIVTVGTLDVDADLTLAAQVGGQRLLTVSAIVDVADTFLLSVGALATVDTVNVTLNTSGELTLDAATSNIEISGATVELEGGTSTKSAGGLIEFDGGGVQTVTISDTENYGNVTVTAAGTIANFQVGSDWGANNTGVLTVASGATTN